MLSLGGRRVMDKLAWVVGWSLAWPPEREGATTLRNVVGVLAMLLCFTPTDIDLPPASRPSAGQVDTQNQAWDILVGGAHGSNIDKRANAIQALGLAAGDPTAVRLAEDALGDKEAYVRAAAAKALGALGSTESIPKLQNLVNDKDISVALAVGHALVQLKSNSGYDVYYSLVVGTRKGSESLITQEMEQMKTPSRAIRFAFDQVLVSCLMEDTEWRPCTHGRKEAPPRRGLPLRGNWPATRTRAVATRSRKQCPTRTGQSARRRSRRSPSAPMRPCWRISCLQCQTRKILCAIQPLPQ